MMPVPGELPVALVCGDPAGVGPDVIEGFLAAEGGAGCCLIGPPAWADPLGARFGAEVLAVGSPGFSSAPGRPSVEGSRLACEALEAASAGCEEGRFSAVVTGPVSKGWMVRAGFPFPGQTEFFADRWGGEPSMAFVGADLRVVLATWHVPLREVPDAVDAACLERAVQRAASLARAWGAGEPKIGVCGINPHAGEGGILGHEERDLLDPVLDRLRADLPGLSCCLPGDTVFLRQRKGEFDAVVAMYHDQGLAAVKTLEFDRAVNVTLGLPYVRTSPDHGTAFELAGTGQADPGSFRSAVAVARRLAGATPDA